MFLFLAVLFIFLLLFHFSIKRRLAVRGWQTLAEQLNLQFTAEKGKTGDPTPGRIDGIYRGRKVSLHVHSERIHHPDGDYDQYYMYFMVALNRELTERLRIVKNWNRSIASPEVGIPLPDRSFSDRFAITHAEPQDFALKMLKNDVLRSQFEQSIGKRNSFTLNISEKHVFLNTKIRGVLLPTKTIEWRWEELKAIFESMCQLADAADFAPAGEWHFTHLNEEPEVQQHNELGAVRGVYTVANQKWNFSGGTVIVLALFLLVLSFDVLQKESISVGFVLMGFAGVMLLIGYLYFHARSERYMLFDFGMTHQKGHRVSAYAWKDIDSVWQRFYPGMSNSSYTLIFTDGKKVRLGKRLNNQSQMLDEMLEKTSARLKLLYLSRLRSGYKLDFGIFSLEPGKLFFKNTSYDIAELSSISQNERGGVFVRGKNGHVLIGNIACHKIKNLHVLTDMINQFNDDSID